jgi:hypothetical protein
MSFTTFNLSNKGLLVVYRPSNESNTFYNLKTKNIIDNMNKLDNDKQITNIIAKQIYNNSMKKTTEIIGCKYY